MPDIFKRFERQFGTIVGTAIRALPYRTLTLCYLVLVLALCQPAQASDIIAAEKPEQDLLQWSQKWREFYAQQPDGQWFARHAYVDLQGRKATDAEITSFVDDNNPDKRKKLIDRLIAAKEYVAFQSERLREHKAPAAPGKARPSRILRGPMARLRAEVCNVAWGEPDDGLQVGISLCGAGPKIQNGQRLPLEIYVRNVGPETVTTGFSFDFIWKVPTVIDREGKAVPIEALMLAGSRALYTETLRSGDIFVCPHLGLGIGDNPNPGENWNPHTPKIAPGKYRLVQSVTEGQTGEVEFEVVSEGADTANAAEHDNPIGTAGRGVSDGRTESPSKVQTIQLRFVGSEKNEPLAGIQVEITNGYGDAQKKIGPLTTDQNGTIKVKLLPMFYHLLLTSTKPFPYLPVEVHWNKRSRGPSPSMSLNVKPTGPEKWLDGDRRKEGEAPPAKLGDAPMITYTLLKATELVLRAVDVDTGKGVAGVEFYTENAVGEEWAHPVYGHNLGSKFNDEGRAVDSVEPQLTDKNGDFRQYIGANQNYMYGIWKLPAGYVAVDPRSEVEVDVIFGQARAEHVFKCGRKPNAVPTGPANVKPAAKEKPATEKPAALQRKPGQTGHGVVLSVKGRVTLDGPPPELRPLEFAPKNGKPLKVPDESILISKDGGIANIAIYMKKAPKDWTPTPAPPERLELRATELRFEPRLSFLRVGQPLRLLNPEDKYDNFHFSPRRCPTINIAIPGKANHDIAVPFRHTESIPTPVQSDIFPWKKAWILALDHPFAAITAEDGQFEIRDLPRGEHHFVVSHERGGILNKDLVITVETDKVTEVNLKYTAEALEP